MNENTEGFGSDRFCGILVGGECGDAQSLNSWTVSIPDSKPPVETPQMPPDVSCMIGKPTKIGDVMNTSHSFQETIKFLHLSDIHIDLFYNTSAAGSDCGQPLCCREENGIVGANSSGYWGDRECGLPIWSFRDRTIPPSNSSHLRS